MSVACGHCSTFQHTVKHESIAAVKACAHAHYAPKPVSKPKTWAELAAPLNLEGRDAKRYALPREGHDEPFLFSVQRGRLPHIVFVNPIGRAGGKVFGGLTVEQARHFLGLIAENPAAAAELYAESTGRCSRCGRFLKANESVQRGLGPVCATKG